MEQNLSLKKNNFDVDYLFQQNSKQYFEELLNQELQHFEEIQKENLDFSDEKEIHQKANYTLETSELITFDFSQYFQKYPNLYKQVKSIKIVNNLKIIIFITTIDQIGFFDLQSEQFWLQQIGKDIIEDIDYDERENIFILARKYGKISFGVYSHVHKKLLINSKDDIEGISDGTITHVKFLLSIDLIFICDYQGIGQLLIRKAKKLRYKNKKIISFEHNKLKNIIASQLLIKKFLNNEEDEQELIDVIIGLTNSNKVFLMQVRVLYEEKRLKKVYKENLLFSQSAPMTQILDQDKQNIQILMGKDMWAFESYDYLIIIYQNRIVQYFIQVNSSNYEIDINLSFELDIDKQILNAFIGAPEQLVVVDSNYQISHIFLNKLRYKIKLVGIEDYFWVEKSNVNTEKKSDSIIIGEDFNLKAFCFFNSDSFQYYFIFSWKTYIKNLLDLSLNLEAIELICDLVVDNPSAESLHQTIFLKDVYFIKSQCATKLDYQKQKIQDYIVDLQKQASNIFYYTLNSALLKSDKAHLLVFIIMKLLVKTNNHTILFNDFLNFLIQYKLQDENFVNKFFISLLHFQDKNFGIYYTDNIINKIFDVYFENQNNKIIRKFIYNIHKKLNLNSIQIKCIKNYAYQKSLDMYLFYLTTTNPNEFILFSDLSQILFESKNPVYFLRFLIIVFDMLHDQKILSCNFHCQKQKYDISGFQKQIENFFLDNLEQLILLSFKKVIWLFIEIYNNLYTKLAFPNDDPTMMINGVQKEYSVKIQYLINRNYDFQFQLLPFIFYFSIQQAKFNDIYIEDVLKRVLDQNILNQAEKQINLYYLFDYIYDLYFDYRDDIKKNKMFEQYLEKNKDDKTIYFIILSDIKNQIEQYFQLYLEKNWFFKVMKKNLEFQDREDYVKSVELIKSRVNQIIENDQEQFMKILDLIKIPHQIEIIKNIINNDKLQFLLLQKIAQKNYNYIIGDTSILYFSLICTFEPDRIIEFLEKNVYDIDKIIKVCEKTGNQRALGYMKYKMNKIQEAMIIYQQQIKFLWEQQTTKEEEKKNFMKVRNLVRDILGFQLDENTITKIFIELLVFISKLKKKDNKIKILIKEIFNSWVNINYPVFIKEIKLKKKWEHFKHNKDLISVLLINMENTTDFNEQKRKIISFKGFNSKENFIELKQKGLFLQKKQCLMLEKHDVNYKPSHKLLYHKCGSMVEKNCLGSELFEKQICLFCSNIKNRKIKSKIYRTELRSAKNNYIKNSIFRNHKLKLVQ